MPKVSLSAVISFVVLTPNDSSSCTWVMPAVAPAVKLRRPITPAMASSFAVLPPVSWEPNPTTRGGPACSVLGAGLNSEEFGLLPSRLTPALRLTLLSVSMPLSNWTIACQANMPSVVRSPTSGIASATTSMEKAALALTVTHSSKAPSALSVLPVVIASSAT